MQIAANTLIYFDLPAPQAVAKLAALGFTAIDIFGDTPALDYRDITDSEIRELCALRERHGLEFSLHGPCWDLNAASANRWHRDDVVAHYRQGIELAAALGAHIVTVHSGWLSDPKLSRQDALHCAADTISRCAPTAERAGVVLAVENVGYGPTGMFHDPQEWADIARAIASPAVKLTLDTGHAALQGFDLAAAVHAAGPLLVHLHLHNNNGQADDHLPLTEGHLDFAPLVQALQSSGFTGHGAIEIYTATHQEEALLASRDLLARLWPTARH